MKKLNEIDLPVWLWVVLAALMGLVYVAANARKVAIFLERIADHLQ